MCLELSCFRMAHCMATRMIMMENTAEFEMKRRDRTFSHSIRKPRSALKQAEKCSPVKPKAKKFVTFIIRPQVVGYADPHVDRRPISVAPISYFELVLLLSQRVFPPSLAAASGSLKMDQKFVISAEV